MTLRTNGNEDRIVLLRELQSSRHDRTLRRLGRRLAVAGLATILVVLVTGWTGASRLERSPEAGSAQPQNMKWSPERPELAALIGERGS